MGHPSREEENTQNKQLSVTQNKYILLLLFKKKPMSKKKCSTDVQSTESEKSSCITNRHTRYTGYVCVYARALIDWHIHWKFMCHCGYRRARISGRDRMRNAALICYPNNNNNRSYLPSWCFCCYLLLLSWYVYNYKRTFECNAPYVLVVSNLEFVFDVNFVRALNAPCRFYLLIIFLALFSTLSEVWNKQTKNYLISCITKTAI